MKKQLVLAMLSILVANWACAASVCLSHRSADGSVHKNAPGEAVNANPSHPTSPVRQAPGEANQSTQRVDTVPMGGRTNDPLSSGPSLQINSH